MSIKVLVSTSVSPFMDLYKRCSLSTFDYTYCYFWNWVCCVLLSLSLWVLCILCVFSMIICVFFVVVRLSRLCLFWLPLIFSIGCDKRFSQAHTKRASLKLSWHKRVVLWRALPSVSFMLSHCVHLAILAYKKVHLHCFTGKQMFSLCGSPSN